MEILESYPRLGPAQHAAVYAAPWSRIGNRQESKRELLLHAFGALCSQHRTGHGFFPYAIPLPHKGEGRSALPALGPTLGIMPAKAGIQ
jgi:hypothetical protein